MTREEVYTRLHKRVNTLREFAQQKGDGVLADKVRKIRQDVIKLESTEENLHKECD